MPYTLELSQMNFKHIIEILDNQTFATAEETAADIWIGILLPYIKEQCFICKTRRLFGRKMYLHDRATRGSVFVCLKRCQHRCCQCFKLWPQEKVSELTLYRNTFRHRWLRRGILEEMNKVFHHEGHKETKLQVCGVCLSRNTFKNLKHSDWRIAGITIGGLLMNINID